MALRDKYSNRAAECSVVDPNEHKSKFSLVQEIFSIKNICDGDNKKYKVVTILGIEFKFKRNKKNKKLSLACDIANYEELIDLGTEFPHPVGIVISRAVTIGRNCIIYQNVTIGAKSFKDGDFTKPENYPVIGDNVKIYAGACVLGGIKIGNNVTIGANSVVLNDIPDNCTVAGAPAKAINRILEIEKLSGGGDATLMRKNLKISFVTSTDENTGSTRLRVCKIAQNLKSKITTVLGVKLKFA